MCWVGEIKSINSTEASNEKKLTLSHVVPDLITKALEGNDHIEILGQGNQIRHYTYGEDLAEGIVSLLKHPNAKNNDFNLSTDESTSVIELAELIWKRLEMINLG